MSDGARILATEGETIVIGDAHLRSDAPPQLERELVAVLERHRDAAVVFAGDTLDLPADPEGGDRGALARLLERSNSFRHTLASRAERRVPTTFLAGNHDALLTTAEGAGTLLDGLGLEGGDRAFVRAEPWLHRIAGGRVHIEHGHAFDPDGAPTHPLAPAPRDDVGIAILRSFVVPTGTHVMVHAHAQTPLQIMRQLFRRYGAKTPWIVARYVSAAAGVVRESGRRLPLADDRVQGKRMLAAFAEDVGLDVETLEMLVDAHATPTRARATQTFLRLYLDRVSACFGTVAGATAATVGTMVAAPTFATVGMAVASASALALAASVLAGKNRYDGKAARDLEQGAAIVADVTGVSKVVFAHAHVEVESERYANTGSFAFPKTLGRRPYLAVSSDGEVRRLHHLGEAATH